MAEYVQEFRKVVGKSGYKERVLVEEFKKEMSRVIRRKLMEAERPPTSIEQQYECATDINRYQRKS